MGGQHDRDEDHMRARLKAPKKKKRSADTKSGAPENDTSNIIVMSFAEIMRQKKMDRDKSLPRKRAIAFRTKHDLPTSRKQHKFNSDAPPSSTIFSTPTLRGTARGSGQPSDARPPLGKPAVVGASISSSVSSTSVVAVAAKPRNFPVLQAQPSPARGIVRVSSPEQPSASAHPLKSSSDQPTPSQEAVPESVSFEYQLNALFHEIELANQLIEECSRLPDPEFHDPMPDIPNSDDATFFITNMSEVLTESVS